MGKKRERGRVFVIQKHTHKKEKQTRNQKKQVKGNKHKYNPPPFPFLNYN